MNEQLNILLTICRKQHKEKEERKKEKQKEIDQE